jgi:hypothetical protein
VTLIYSAAPPIYALQVSDRLLSSNGVSVDHEANKTVLLCGSDGIVSLSYTGPAYLRGMPTDNRIAEALTRGAAIQERGMTFGPLIRPLDIGLGLRRIRDHLRGFRRFAEGGGEVIGVGWQWGV